MAEAISSTLLHPPSLFNLDSKSYFDHHSPRPPFGGVNVETNVCLFQLLLTTRNGRTWVMEGKPACL